MSEQEIVNSILKGETDFNIYFDNKRIVFLLIPHCYSYFKNCSKRLKDDEDIAMLALNNSRHAFYELSKRLKKKKKIVLRSLSGPALVFLHISKKLKRDKDVVETAIHFNGNMLINSHPKFYNNKKYAIRAVSNFWYNGYPSLIEKFKNDHEIITIALKKGLCYNDLSDIHKKNIDYAILFFKRYPYDFAFFKFLPELKSNTNFLIKILSINNSIFKFIDDKFKNNKNIILTTAKNIEWKIIIKKKEYDEFEYEIKNIYIRDDFYHFYVPHRQYEACKRWLKQHNLKIFKSEMSLDPLKYITDKKILNDIDFINYVSFIIDQKIYFRNIEESFDLKFNYSF